MKTVAVIGAGYWGRNLVRVFQQLNVLRTVCDSNQAALDNLLRSPDILTPGSEPFRTAGCPDEVLADRSVKAVVIATPAVTHFRVARAALLAGKDVFVEKPLALRLNEGRILVRMAEERRRILMVGHILNYHPAVLKLKELIAGSALGRIYYVYSNRLNFGKIRTEENILWSFAPHDISVILGLLEEEPDRVTATAGTYLQPGIPDITLSGLFFRRSGVRAHIFVSWLHPYKEQKLVVVGSEKMAVFDDTAREKLVLYPHKVAWQGRIPTARKAEMEPVPLRTEEPLLAEARHFLACVRKRTAPLTDGHEGLRVLKVLNRCQVALSRKN